MQMLKNGLHGASKKVKQILFLYLELFRKLSQRFISRCVVNSVKAKRRIGPVLSNSLM